MKAIENTWLCADCHFGHNRMAEIRGFEDNDAMCDTIVKNINEVVPTNGKLIILGDVVWNVAGLKWLSQINCKKRIVMGNHDTLEPAKYIQAGVKKLYGAVSLTVKDVRVVLTHIPTHPVELDRWDINIHGHKHSEKIQGVLENNYICVSLEQTNYKPVRLVDIVDEWNNNNESHADRNDYLFIKWS